MFDIQERVSRIVIGGQLVTSTFRERFWKHVKKLEGDNACWVWTGAKNPKGYGWINSGVPRARTMLAHRASWLIHFGVIPEGKCVLHDCPNGDNTSCIRPDHLWLGTTPENNEDTVDKGRFNGMRPGESHIRHKLTNEQIAEIRKRHNAGEMDSRLALEFGVVQPTIHNIVQRKSWKHIT